ncbi:MAG: repressor LexA [Chlorobiota bacterium]|nr:repressor LexA [Chlorobiota bacterium]QQS65918.1 MAG: repressor LexA [Chlorobiota bacterium]
MKEITSRQLSILLFIEQYLRNNQHPPTEREIGSHFNIFQNAVKKHLLALEKKGKISLLRGGKSRGIKLKDYPVAVNVPIIAYIKNKNDITSKENTNGYYSVDEVVTGTEGSFLIEVKSDEMSGAGIKIGDKLVFRKMNYVRNGELVAGFYNGELYIRKFFQIADRVLLESSNNNFPTIAISNIEDFKIEGRAVSLIREISGTNI